ncbi:MULTISPECIES: HdeD family acid-resistance protein [Streptomyces]|uniref:HdeD family acid-resistance protein n=1 Tax=Streptomyces TaxID=1883 RepID=UPI0013712492|nr:HdeD family acid-resistance protein [Streptomyces sp. SID2888]MYV45899.1 HdeD family acid-resistance protein [Streptomyces sp. SID2888]
MTDIPDRPPHGSAYDDRHVHATRDPHAPASSPYGVEPPFEGVLHALSRTAWQVVLLTGLASLVLGIVLLVWPGPSLLVAGILFGLYLIVSGVLQLAAAFGTHKTTALRVLAFISGTLSILLGLFCFRGPLESILLLALWIGIGWLIRGVTQAMAAAHDPGMPARGWQIFLGVVTFVAGVVLIVSPFASIALLTWVAGWWLLVVGVIEIITAIRLHGHAQQQIPRTV